VIDVFAVAGKWWAGVAPVVHASPWKNSTELSAVFSAALAAAECFFRLVNPVHPPLKQLQYVPLLPGVGPQSIDTGPDVLYLPSRLDLIGLGHLGQAYAWVVAMLPYSDRSKVQLHLLDFDRVTQSTPSTSILTKQSDVNSFKTRVVSSWLERAGFDTRIIEASIHPGYRRRPDGPAVALIGVDNVPARLVAVNAQYDLLIDGGIGSRATTYDALCVRSFPNAQNAKEIWSDTQANTQRVVDMDAYKALRNRTVDACGIVRLAAKAVGVPFVGMVTACFAITQLIRVLHGRGADEVTALQLRSPDDLDRALNKAIPLSLSIDFQEAGCVDGARQQNIA
jgi:hypothetical protein